MKHAVLVAAVRSLWCKRPRRFTALCVLALAVGFVLLAGPAARASDVYSNIGPAPQLPAGGLLERYPIVNYQLDQYFPVISVGLTSGIDVSGLAPFLAYFLAQIIWMITAFLAYAVITVFAFAFNLDLVNGNGTPGSGALTPISTAIHNLYASTFGAPWLIAMVILVGCWAMWKALVQRRYTETASALAISLLYFVLAVGIVTQPERTIAPASKLTNQLSTALLSLTSNGSIGNEGQAKLAESNQLFELLVLDPWTVLEFGGLEHCTTTSSGGKSRSVAVRPLASDPDEDSRLAAQLETTPEIRAQGKTCVNNKLKYASHFLAYPLESHDRGAEHEALENADTEDLPESDPAKHDGSYPLGAGDKSAVEAMGKGGQVQRLLLSLVTLAGELGAFALLGSLAVGVITAQILLLTMLGFAPVALLVGIFPGRGHEFFGKWLGKLAGYLARKAIYSLILAVLLAVSRALADASSNLGWLLAFGIQAAFLWTVFLQRNRLTADLMAATVGTGAAREGASRLQTLYYTTRLARMAIGNGSRRAPAPISTASPSPSPGEAPQNDNRPSGDTPPDSDPPPPSPSGGPSSGGGSPGPNETPTRGPGSPTPATPGGVADAPGDRPRPKTAADEPSPTPGASAPERASTRETVVPNAGAHLQQPAQDSPASSAPPAGVAAPPAASPSVASAPSAPEAAPLPAKAPGAAGEGSPRSSAPAGVSQEPVAVLLRARETTAVTDPATEGEVPL
jgi:hypothetical protein